MAALLPAVLRRDLGTAFLRSPNCFFVIRRFEQRRLQLALIFGIEIERRIQADLREARRVTDQSRAPRRHCPASTILSPRVASFRNVTELTEQTLRKIIVRQRCLWRIV